MQVTTWLMPGGYTGNCSRLLATMLLGSKRTFSTTSGFDASVPKMPSFLLGAKTEAALNEIPTFTKLVNEEKSILWLTKKELEGIPDHYFDLLQNGSLTDDTSSQTFGISYGHFEPSPLLVRVENAEVRKRICVWNENRLADLVEKHKILVRERARTAAEKK